MAAACFRLTSYVTDQGIRTTPSRQRQPLAEDRARRQRVKRRTIPLAVLGAIAFLIGLVIGCGHVPDEQKIADKFAKAWQSGDFKQMRALTSAQSQDRISAPAFVAAYRLAQETATQSALTVGKASEPDNGVVRFPVKVRTALFGLVKGSVGLRFDGEGSEAKVDWSADLTFPGLQKGELLSRRTQLAPRASLLAADGQVLAQGPDRGSPIPEVANEIVGELGPAPPGEVGELRAQGIPDGASVGISGLEKVFQRQLAGKPGGQLLAGNRVLASATKRQGSPVRTTIVVKLEEAAIAALGGRPGAIVAMKPTGQIQALAGRAFSILQPPGSTFKIITAAAALEAGIVKLSTEFPYETEANVGGFILANADGELCGGTFEQAFAESCNSVFAPLGVKVGAKALVAMAERFGFNTTPSVAGAKYSEIPSAQTIGSETDLGASSIGQGRVQATTLTMTSVAATIATGGLRYPPTLDATFQPKPTRAIKASTAATIRSMMVGAVKYGTGAAAQIDGVKVAGKTGTAELGKDPTTDKNITEDAWFVCFAPSLGAKIVVGVLLVQAGAGADYAAPTAREVLATGIGK
ncbi:MAG: penicillin-binding transpeptidase domain-containing protein [Actinomycetota bacterium]